jgi:hypothetical protein
MHRPAFKRIVEILAMRRGAVDESRAGGIERTAVADRRAGAVIVPSGKRACDIVLVPRGRAQTDDIDQQVLAFVRGRGRQRTRFQGSDFRGQCFGDGDFRQVRGHEPCPKDQTWKILL